MNTDDRECKDNKFKMVELQIKQFVGMQEKMQSKVPENIVFHMAYFLLICLCFLASGIIKL